MIRCFAPGERSQPGMGVDAATRDRQVAEADVAVVGAGPAGIVTALELAASGSQVLLIESGRRRFWSRAQDLGDAACYDPRRHAPMRECTRRQIGGASVIWGGRCLPYDPIDFEPRDYIPHSNWPVRYEDLVPYFERACEHFRCGRAEFDLNRIPSIAQKSVVPGLPDGEVLSSSLERWSLPTNFGSEYGRALRESKRIRLLHSLTCTEIDVEDSGDHVRRLRCRSLGTGREIDVKARVYVLACGGIDTTRLLLASDRVHPGGIGNHGDKLGRYYMGHISGRIARVHFTTPPRDTVYGYDRDVDGTYLRRRLSFSPEFQREKRLTNIVAFLVNPEIRDPSHRSGVLSFAFLALASPLGAMFVADAIRRAALGPPGERQLLRHMANMLLDLGRTFYFIPTFGYRRFIARRKIPGFFQRSRSNAYPLHYHGEQVPDPDSRITLAEERDELGMRRVEIDLRFSEQDVDGVIRAHRHWDEYLKKHGVGYLEYMDDDPMKSVWEQATDGFHQAGTTRMSRDPADGVVDPNCRAHGVDNLFVASSSNFVTSGQANSTFMIVVFALRMVDHLRSGLLARRTVASASHSASVVEAP